MPDARDPNAIRLPDDVAQRLLARATELDERHGRTSIDQLRRAATEAGISLDAFDAALAELARGELGRPAAAALAPPEPPRRWVTSPLRRVLLIAGAAIAAALIIIGGARAVTQVEEAPAVEVQAAPPDVELVPAAPPDAGAPPRAP